mmetsp:Transcript_26251/g.86993  ORF Transcript_26251/g.86993 Transcript_26251/m.86993 type:complete len:392 (-) Transcript_26251:210-1385(-)|eukprot:CAMPEP_0177257214 /NCGR_PEP_ID=MMETSP0367-20130122/57406_1 /TAXON_ID=447022 ORGANISM="Scrippsiella hangoei-like, Strain SHHI-4" /NCGR_SAMPLE_ID=MMETSP0367 /ASSEMBLY_ACC=CAM_ASM_000362 /LENGTH=391 /DNA_ID=CAMNT_0018711251 /DNA_START=61 /DNA_END=1236 /DNA_ORIENTATION=+
MSDARHVIDPQRRRLTVGRGPGGSTTEAVAAAAGGAAQGRLEACGLSAIFERAGSTGQKAFLVCSITDRDRQRRRSFTDKDEQVCFNSAFEDEKSCRQYVKTTRLAIKCRKGLKPESPNQDSFCVVSVEGEFAWYGIFDGHGPNGHDVSDFALSVLTREFVQRREQGVAPKDALEQSFQATQDEIEAKNNPSHRERLDSSMSGTTCTVAYHDIPGQTIWIAHVGDSRAIISAQGNPKEAEVLGHDHKPDLPEEKKRIESRGGRVIFDGFYNHRVFSAKGQYPGLNMSRALGDVVGHTEAGLSAVPDVKEVSVPHGDPRLLLLCTDGVWEFIESRDAMHMALKTKRPDELTPEEMDVNLERIAKESWDRWMKDSDNEISDDITGIAVGIGCD